MRKIPLLLILLLLIFNGSIARATTLVDTLNKKFKKTAYPHDEVTATIRLETKLNYLRGNQKEQDFVRTLKVHEKAVHTFKQNGWVTNDQLVAGALDAGKIEFEVGEGMNLKLDKTLRLKAYLYQCDHPMRKYRGGDLNEFFNKTVRKKAEYCFTYDQKLQETSTY